MSQTQDPSPQNQDNFKRGFFKSPVHQRKFKKNLTVGLIMIGFMAMIWAVTMIKVAGWS